MRERRKRRREVLVRTYCVACGVDLPTVDAEDFHVGFNPDHDEIRSVYEMRAIEGASS